MSTSPFDTTIAPGEEVLVRGRNKRSCVSRPILAHVQNKQYIVLTPGGQMMNEDYANASGAEIRDHETRAGALGLGKITEDFEVLPTNDEFFELADRANAMAAEYRTSTEFQVQAPEQPAAALTVAASAAAQSPGGSSQPPGPRNGRQPFTPTFGLDRPPARVVGAPATPSGGLGALAAALGGAMPGVGWWGP
jgi:hypothetical protein